MNPRRLTTRLTGPQQRRAAALLWVRVEAQVGRRASANRSGRGVSHFNICRPGGGVVWLQHPKFFQVLDHPQGFTDARGAVHSHGNLKCFEYLPFRCPGIQRTLGL